MSAQRKTPERTRPSKKSKRRKPTRADTDRLLRERSGSWSERAIVRKGDK
jgi:hypothetical protein